LERRGTVEKTLTMAFLDRAHSYSHTNTNTNTDTNTNNYNHNHQIHSRSNFHFHLDSWMYVALVVLLACTESVEAKTLEGGDCLFYFFLRGDDDQACPVGMKVGGVFVFISILFASLIIVPWVGLWIWSLLRKRKRKQKQKQVNGV